jgi:hypothetical protein
VYLDLMGDHLGISISRLGLLLTRPPTRKQMQAGQLRLWQARSKEIAYLKGHPSHHYFSRKVLNYRVLRGSLVEGQHSN